MPRQAQSVSPIDQAELLELHCMLLRDNGFHAAHAAGVARGRRAPARL